MRASLRLRVLLTMVAINVAVLGAGALYLAERLREDHARVRSELTEALVYTLRSTIQPEGELNVASILQWPTWSQFADALILDRNWDEDAEGRILPRGVCLHPLGAARRRADFDRDEVLAAVARAVRSGRPVEDVAGGRAVPIRHADGTWGGGWYRIDRSLEDSDLLRLFLGAFGVSTVLLTAATFIVLRRFVLDPVDAMASAARRISAGDLGARVTEPERHDEVAELLRTFNAMTAQVQGTSTHLEQEVRRATEMALAAEAAAMTQRRLAATGELAAGIAHEINNPLGGLQNAVEALAGGRLSPEKRQQYLELLRGGLERIRSTVGQLLRFTPRSTHTAPVELLVPVRDAIALAEHRADRLGVRIRLGAGPRATTPAEVERAHADVPAIEGEANELAQAILNLLVNSLDAIEESGRGSGRIDVDLRREGDEVVLDVRDDGPGIPAERIDRVSNLFYTTKEVGRGTGLGLAVVHNVVSSHGGSVRLSSPAGAGLTVSLRLPLQHRRNEPRPGRARED